MRELLLGLSFLCLCAGAYAQLGLRNSYSSYSTEQLEILTHELDSVGSGSDDLAREARVSRTLVEDERLRRWSRTGLFLASPLFALLALRVGRSRRESGTGEDGRLLTYLGSDTEGMPGGRQHAAHLLGIAVGSAPQVVQAAFDAQLKSRKLDDLEGLAPDLRRLQEEKLAQLERARDILLRGQS
jgi:hypothetical protein